MIDIKDQYAFRINSSEFIENPLFPTFVEKLLRVKILGEKSALVGHTQEIEDRRNHFEVRNQNRLREVACEILVVLSDPSPETRDGAAEDFGVDLVEVSANFEALVNLIRLQLA